MDEDGGIVSPARTLRCVFVGDELLVSQCAVIARDAGLLPVLVVSRSDLALDHARDEGLDVVAPGRGEALADVVADVDADVLFTIAYTHIVPAAVLDRFDVAINFHDGLLPRYGGLNVTTWSVLNGETEHGITWHLMDELADRGEIVHEERFAIGPTDTALAVNARCYEAGLASFGAVADALARGELRTRPQPEGERRMYRRIERPVVFIDPSDSTDERARSIRAIDTGARSRAALGAAHVRIRGIDLIAREVEVAPTSDGSAPGAVVRDGSGVRLTLADGELIVREVTHLDGSVLDEAELEALDGATFTGPTDVERETLVAHDPTFSAAESWWAGELVRSGPTPHALLDDGDRRVDTVDVDVPAVAGSSDGEIVTTVVLWLQAIGDGTVVSLSISDASTRSVTDSIHLARHPVVVVEVDPTEAVEAAMGRVGAAVDAARRHGPWLADLVARDPDLRGEVVEPDVAIHLEVGAADQDPGEHVPGAPLTFLRRSDGSLVVRHRLDDDVAARIVAQLQTVADGLRVGGRAVGELAVVSTLDLERLDAWNGTDVDHDRSRTIDAMFEAQASRTPAAPAISCGDDTLSYSELLDETARMAALLAANGVSSGDVVGIALDRGIDMVVSVLATLAVGAAYLPLDPGYPADRLQHMVDDSGTHVIVGDAGRSGFGGDRDDLRFVDPLERSGFAPTIPERAHRPDDLAYTIYTSGSTGVPKGVLLEHRQVVNFFTAMDAVIDHDVSDSSGSRVWLAVTSLSFDISVLELLWTLTVGFHVVVKRDSGFAAAASNGAPSTRRRRARTSAPEMSMFYFAADAAQANDGYRLLMESARWADEHGFSAVWTPERHFHDFGAPYPNPSVIGAALAATTRHVAIRAGSVVIPLHSPIRIAEEWAVVDNLSRGRVGISFAAGWQPNDFVLNPGAYATARESLPGLVDTVQRLWRGETVELPGHDGAPVSVATMPRPVQGELPVWVTSAGSPASFERAGTLGFNVLTHLIGQTLDQLEQNIDRYRAARSAAGHPGDGHITLMLHSYLHADADHAREVARGPLTGYLGTAVGLLKDLASAFPTFGGSGADADEAFRSLADDELAQLLDHAAERYLSTAGLFGSLDDGIEMARAVVDVGVDEIACLVDFGIDDDAVLDGLPLLDEVRRRLVADAEPSPATVAAAEPETVGGLIRRFGVTHLQCTPSLASMLAANPDDRAALAGVGHMMVGGEAIAPALANELLDVLPDRLTNMYGPTETTIWSLVHEIDRDAAGGASVPIGRPIANTTMFVLDAFGRRAPVGVYGELHLGGEGVARGYHDRPDITAERFVTRETLGRTYATGDVVRIRPDGIVEFAGRSDNQVKIRGHRIELSEIEVVIDSMPMVVQSVVSAFGSPEPSLVAHVVCHQDDAAAGSEQEQRIREHVRSVLPDAMVPSTVVVLEAFPLTPNGKIDRNRLPAPTVAGAASDLDDAEASDTEHRIAGIWTAHLGRAVGHQENFFDVGGHSLLAVKMYREIATSVDPALALTDIFRFPTIRTFAAHVDSLSTPSTASSEPKVDGAARGAMRRRARTRHTVAPGRHDS